MKLQTIPGEGTYTVAPTNGTFVTFVPEKSFTGESRRDGEAISNFPVLQLKYTPTVTPR